MRFIKKKQQPQSLIETKKTIPLPKYGNLDRHVMDDIYNSLLEEQGHICCYCMQRIEFGKMQIEHYQSQANFPELQLEFQNMLGVCTGKIDSKPRNILHCDSARSQVKEELEFLKPHDKSKNYIIQQLKYRASGEIESENEQVQKELEQKLNLNVEKLKILRKSVIDAVIMMIQQKFKREGMKKSFLESEIEKANTTKNGKLMPFCQVKIYYLEKKLKQFPK